MPGHDDHWEIDALILQRLLDLEAVHPRHADIEQDAALFEMRTVLDEVDAGLVRLNSVP
jgi:hypothetical protein